MIIIPTLPYKPSLLEYSTVNPNTPPHLPSIPSIPLVQYCTVLQYDKPKSRWRVHVNRSLCYCHSTVTQHVRVQYRSSGTRWRKKKMKNGGWGTGVRGYGTGAAQRL